MPHSNLRAVKNVKMLYYYAIGGQCEPVTLEKLLIFASGLQKLPPLGFQTPPSLEFLHREAGERRPLSEANTCTVCIRLPVHPTYEEFEHWMNSGMLQSPHFGLAQVPCFLRHSTQHMINKFCYTLKNGS